MRCPRCQAPLALQDLFTGGRHATVVACGACGGHWLKGTDLQRLSEIVEPVLAERPGYVTGPEQAKVLHCPECESAPAMRKHTSPRDPRVLLDGCDVCGGAWLDGGELRAIQQESLAELVGRLLRPA